MRRNILSVALLTASAISACGTSLSHPTALSRLPAYARSCPVEDRTFLLPPGGAAATGADITVPPVGQHAQRTPRAALTAFFTYAAALPRLSAASVPTASPNGPAVAVTASAGLDGAIPLPVAAYRDVPTTGPWVEAAAPYQDVYLFHLVDGHANWELIAQHVAGGGWWIPSVARCNF